MFCPYDPPALRTLRISPEFKVSHRLAGNASKREHFHIMDGNDASSDQVIEKLIEMGFEDFAVKEGVKARGPSFVDALDYILNGPCRNGGGTSSSSRCSTGNRKALRKRAFSSLHPSSETRQSSILDHFQFKARPKPSKVDAVPDMLVSGSNVSPSYVKDHRDCTQELDIGTDWEKKAISLLQNHFGYSSLKNFQKEALAAWFAHQDCLVLAATGSGKSLCFQIPALLTGKVVVVISPLISLMHDQCLKLAKHGISACFLGSGQPDSSVEQKAMRGMYDIIYVCPETILRLIEPLQRLAESRGIALFAIDEVHCVSKWGHDFRPDYRRLSVLRENFSACNLKFLEFDIPLMALTATATIRVREDILKSLSMSKETKIVLTSFFRSNLRFSVKHSRTSSPSSYGKDFCELIDIYVRKRKTGYKKQITMSEELGGASDGPDISCIYKADGISRNDQNHTEDSYSDRDIDEPYSMKENGSTAMKGKEMSIEYLENDVDVFHGVDDWDVAFGEFCGQSPHACWGSSGLSKTVDPPNEPKEILRLLHEPLEQGLTIIYVPTRKETLNITKYLCERGVKAAAYNASLPKSHLRQVHKEFHENNLEVVVATIAFGMGIDKLNVRRIIHYGWPQSLEAYYQEAGRAGRDGKLADCTLYANLTRVPSLLPSKRSEEQTKHAYKMLSDCFRYGMNTYRCRAKTLVEYFGEDLSYEKCLLCDVCVDGPPGMQNLKEEADVLMQAIASHHEKESFMDGSYDDATCTGMKQWHSMEMPNLRMLVGKIREQVTLNLACVCVFCDGGNVCARCFIWGFKTFLKFLLFVCFYLMATCSPKNLWQLICYGGEVLHGLWKIKDTFERQIRSPTGDGNSEVLVCTRLKLGATSMFVRLIAPHAWIHVQIQFPEPTKLGLELFQSEKDQFFYVYPEADMLLSVSKHKSCTTFSEWGKGWADPEIRRQRLERMQVQRNRKPERSTAPRKRKHRGPQTSRSRKSSKRNPDLRTVRGRIESKLSKYQ
ncbi:ATP-dependent DNA helicase Q-like SIM isoform X3 [Carya illinoinensis]|uniref:ATP-dependent DNA helicase Q-like SIM isoform X3 n=1 Tax=Carya illinoinensis TaxID=32201 RepID=UPI001C728A0E|nr:ATP-dependent DNA helicase Q-like SIM isoform X3 [Carya illinoinensis]